ncbi:MAG: preprotein translocase subunit SecY [Kiritimatiellae bacterium]|nr:preprotein translocase subunit SecY [Kiritimatiellia bacterium]
MAMMKGFSNAFRIPELRKKIFVTLGLVFVCRLVAQIPTPGVDWATLNAIIERFRSSESTLFSWFETFSGGALGQCSIGFLSIWPYISAQIVIQLLSSIIPSLEKLKKEGENGRQQLAQITRYLTIGLCVAQAWGISTVLVNPQMIDPSLAGTVLVPNAGLGFKLMTVIGMTTASLFVMWLADQITTFGIGNGASLIIMINITSRLPDALQAAYTRYFVAKTAPISGLAVLICFFMIVVMGTVMLVQGVRKVTIHSTRRSVAMGVGFGMQQTFMPLKVNYTGVMPIIFAQPIIQIAAAAVKYVAAPTGRLHDFAMMLSETTWLHIAIYSVLIVFFTFFWVATQFNAVEISENLKKDGSYVPGVRPGRATAEYLDDVMTKITLVGAMGLLAIALIPMLIMSWTRPPLAWSIASFFGGTSLLIIVGVALDTLRIMESHLLVRKYDGFLSHGSLRGRNGR